MKQLVSYQREVDKGKLTPVASFEKMTYRARALRRSKGSKALRRAHARNVSFSKSATAVNLPLSTSG